MAKKQAVPPNLMAHLLEARGAKAPDEARPGTAEAPPKALEGPAEAPLRQGKLWLPETAWTQLAAHFGEKGIPVSTGIRMIVLEYLKQNR